MPLLIEPTSKYKDSFLEAVKEYQADGQQYYLDLDLQKLQKDFSSYVTQQNNWSKGIDLPDGYVPQTTYWLVAGELFIGEVRIRHELNDSLKTVGGHIGYDIRPTQRRKGYGNLILKLALQKAKELGIESVLITCDVTNIGSNKIIKANGGKLDSVKTIDSTKPEKNYYTINL